MSSCSFTAPMPRPPSPTLFPYTTLFRSFTYGRQSGQVDVTLTVHQPDGSEIREVATYLGQPPRKATGDPAARKKREDRKSTRLNSSHLVISYAVFCLKKKQKHDRRPDSD